MLLLLGQFVANQLVLAGGQHGVRAVLCLPRRQQPEGSLITQTGQQGVGFTRSVLAPLATLRYSVAQSAISRSSNTASIPAWAHSSSVSPDDAPLTPTAATSAPPTSIGSPPAVRIKPGTRPIAILAN